MSQSHEAHPTKRLAMMFPFSYIVLVIALSGASTARASIGNTNFGVAALSNNTTGTDNSAFGFFALFFRT